MKNFVSALLGAMWGASLVLIISAFKPNNQDYAGVLALGIMVLAGILIGTFVSLFMHYWNK
jgi:hypothetical protein